MLWERQTAGDALLNRGLNTDRRLQVGQTVVQAVSRVVDGADALTSQICRDGLAYWQGLRGDAPLPWREAIDPAAIRSLLPYTFLVDVVDRGRDFRYRLVGTDIVAHTPHDNTGLLLSEIDAQGTQSQLSALYAAVTADPSPRFQRIAYRTRLGLRSWYETVVCPMSAPDSTGTVTTLVGWAEHFHQPIGSADE